MDKEEVRKPARQRILDTASEMFYRDGIRAVGIDTIIARSGVAKMSLYRNFPSKDALVAAWLEDRNAFFWGRWQMAEEAGGGDPRAQLEAILDMVAATTSHPNGAAARFSTPAPSSRARPSGARRDPGA